MSIRVTTIDGHDNFPYRFSICTLVTSIAQYQAMLASFEQAGFDNRDCEFLIIDNSQTNQFDAYQGINRMLTAAQGRYILYCHQDIALDFDRRPELEHRLAELEQHDPSWAVAGNAGGTTDLGQGLSVRISDPHGKNRCRGPFPARVSSLDENFLIIKNSANLGLSYDLHGFHHYGPDLCLQAEHRGMHCYVIDFHLHHLSGGKRHRDFYQGKQAFIERYQHRFRQRWLRLPCTPVFLSGSPWLNWLCNRPLLYRWVKQWQKLKARLRKSHANQLSA